MTGTSMRTVDRILRAEAVAIFVAGTHLGRIGPIAAEVPRRPAPIDIRAWGLVS